MNSALSLQHQHILITRPAHKQAEFSKMITALGGTAIAFATIEVVTKPPKLPQGHNHKDYPLVIFISANAVNYAHRAGLIWSPKQQLGAVGTATATALDALGYHVALLPKTSHNSEGLLALPALQAVQATSILIVRGEGGREHLANQLRARGAQVDYAEVYRRQAPSSDAQIVTQVFLGNNDNAGCNWITASSGEGLKNLLSMLPPKVHDRVLSTALVVVSTRMVKIAQTLGFNGPIRVAKNASNQAIIEAIACAAH